jgi:hypothetical protein
MRLNLSPLSIQPKSKADSTENQPKFGVASRRGMADRIRPLDPFSLRSMGSQQDTAAGLLSLDTLLPGSGALPARERPMDNNQAQQLVAAHIGQIDSVYQVHEFMSTMTFLALERIRQLTQAAGQETEPETEPHPQSTENTGGLTVPPHPSSLSSLPEDPYSPHLMEIQDESLAVLPSVHAHPLPNAQRITENPFLLPFTQQFPDETEFESRRQEDSPNEQDSFEASSSAIRLPF